MTRLAVLADIHGNLPALQAVIADLTPLNVDQVIVAGDSINWGPFSVQVLEQIYDRRWSVIRGNHEFYLLYYNTPYMPEAWRGFTTTHWLNTSIPAAWQRIIACQPDDLRLCFPDAPYVRVVHGSPGNHWRGIYPLATGDDDVRAMLGGLEEKTVITAHTHLAMDRRVDSWHILNPGSVGVPLDGIAGARYLLLDSAPDGWHPTFRHVPYDLAPVIAECERLDYVGLHGTTGRLMIEELKTGRPLVYAYHQWRRKYHPDLPDDLTTVERFLREPDAAWEFRHPDYKLNVEPVLTAE